MPNSSSSDLSFEREKWEADVRLRERELEIKAQEQTSQAIEVQSRITEQQRSRWSSPLVLAVLAAASAAAGNAFVAWINGSAQRGLESTRSDAQLSLERYKADAQNTLEQTKTSGEQNIDEAKGESARILEMIKTNDPDKAAINLRFLLQAGLIANTQRREDLAKFLSDRQPGQGPALPPERVASRPRSDYGQILSPDAGCKMKDGDKPDSFVSSFRRTILELLPDLTIEPQDTSKEDTKLRKSLWLNSNKDRWGTLIVLYFTASGRGISVDGSFSPDETADDAFILSKPSQFDGFSVSSALVRATLRKLVNDPRCVRGASGRNISMRR